MRVLQNTEVINSKGISKAIHNKFIVWNLMEKGKGRIKKNDPNLSGLFIYLWHQTVVNKVLTHLTFVDVASIKINKIKRKKK